ncbi:hypothetical protein BH09MYX1_BH09MYX1_16970 [soil metagenome]
MPITTAPPNTTKLAATIPLPPGADVFGPAFARDGSSVVLFAGNQLHRFDAATLAKRDSRPVTKAPRLGPNVATFAILHGANGGDAAFDLATASRIVVDVPKGYECNSGESFSDDGTLLARNCVTKADELVIVQDARTGALVVKLTEFQTAAPVRGGRITGSGNFVLWSARASGAFEEIKSKVTGPMMSSHSTMAPDESALFTVVDKNWLTDDKSPAQILDPKTGRAKYTLPFDVDRVYFSPDGRRFAAVRQSMADHKITAVTVHRTADGAVVASLPDRDVDVIAFSPDGHELLVRGGGNVKLYVDVP